MSEEFDYTECKRQYHQDILTKAEENRKAGRTIDPNLMAEFDEVMKGPGWQALINGPEPIPAPVYERYDFEAGRQAQEAHRAKQAEQEVETAEITRKEAGRWAREKAEKERRAKEQQMMEDHLADSTSDMTLLSELDKWK